MDSEATTGDVDMLNAAVAAEEQHPPPARFAPAACAGDAAAAATDEEDEEGEEGTQTEGAEDEDGEGDGGEDEEGGEQQEDEEAETESDEEGGRLRGDPQPASAGAGAGDAAAAAPGEGTRRRRPAAANSASRSHAPSPAPDDLGALLDESRLTARQRARIEKDAGIAADVQWSEMEMPPELAYSWRGKGSKQPSQLTEEEWLRRQEALERRRLRAQRHKREAEENVKARIRKAVTAKFRGKLAAGGEAPSAADGGGGGSGRGRQGDQEAAPIQPGWVKLRRAAAGCTVSWHPAAHPLSFPMAVAAPTERPRDPVDLLLQPPAGGWQVPDASRGSFRPGAALALQLRGSGRLWCVDEHGWAAGSLGEQQVLDAMADAGHAPALLLLLQQQHQQQQCEQQQLCGLLEGWGATVRSVSSTASGPDALKFRRVVVRLAPLSSGGAAASG